MPINKSTEKEKAQYLYLNTAKTQREIAEMLEISERTLYTWVKSGKWAEQKRLTYYSPEQTINRLYEELRELDNNISSRKEGERFSTKQELETKAKILSLINGPLKDTADKWRNIIHEYAIEDSQNAGGEPELRGVNIIIDGIDPRDQNYSNPDW